MHNKSIYGVCGNHLGDCWLGVSYCITHKKRYISRYPWKYHKDTYNKLNEIIPLFGAENKLIIVNNTPSKKILPRTHRHHYARTLIQWQHAYCKRLCYQFDGQSSKARKNIPKHKQREILEYLNLNGITCTQLDNNISLQECVQIAATSDAFFGVESGMTHLCHSVGVPTFIIQSKLSASKIANWHHPNSYCLCANIEILKESLRELIKQNKQFARQKIIPKKIQIPNMPPLLRSYKLPH